ncbi:helix-turn-helix domain-containing protein [Avibacterium paragallinarum]|uniref:helix-turn-helix domain-containing protein n=1 Tax=Avibacterium paragallinarum TaxID=728 RepID=UPI0021BF5460|nr:helix-turn-helix domain-containing protein [Avibacterium paragallinarum]
MAKSLDIYAVYNDEDNLGDGTAEQLAKQFNLSKTTIYRLAKRGDKASKRNVLS